MSSTPRGGIEVVLWAKNPPAPAERSQTPAPRDFESLKISLSLLGRLERDLLEDMGGRGLRGDKRQLQMIDNPVHDGIFREEGDYLHPAAADRNEAL